MTLQNRVDPFGQIHAIPSRGTLMGNRGILHDEQRNVLKTHAHRNWVSCTLSHKNIRRKVMAPSRYTELFFLDEATALAAGHRPCATCRRDRYKAFTDTWQQVHGGPVGGLSLPQTIDRALHKARIDRRKKVTFDAPLADLPDGAMFADTDTPILIWEGRLHRWSFDGYTPYEAAAPETVTVLTPEPLIAVLGQGYRPDVHASLA